MTPTAHESGPTAAAAQGKEYTRGEFLSAATLGVGGLMGALIGLPATAMMLTPALVGEDFPSTSVGKLDQFEEGTFVKVVLEPNADAPDAYVQKRVAFVRRNAPDYKDRFAPRGQEKYTVISNRCVHLGCPVQESGGSFTCPCHGGAYDPDGDRTAGPPVRPLDRFRWEERDGELWLNSEYALKPDGGQASMRGPAQHTGGLQKLFYPLQP